MTEIVPAKLAYNVFEPKSGADESLSPVILLHGLTGNKEYWEDLPQTIADLTKRRTYALDTRNHGASEYVTYKRFSFDMYVVDVLHFMDSVHISKAILVGHSLGGKTAINTALEKPERVEKIVSIDMGVKKFTQEMIEYQSMLVNIWVKAVEEIPKKLDEEQITEYLLDFIFSKLPRKNLAGFLERDNPLLKKMIKNTYFRKEDGSYDVRFNKSVILNTLKDADALTTERSGTFDGPALLMYAEFSPFVLGNVEQDTKMYFPRAECVEFKGAYHFIAAECPEKFFTTLMKFLLN